ncbi:uncharacterized protein H6S33_008023 [Morchella sextelata]|uniref:uncharacterized protein n=1 Tax=Morchella sextelata TaxID=1174677 RepID=UPI001D05A44B|nr:uncharacterized protein H6S33_008023 [Morchella sextelata]KAH0603019.1 hypothetical protein H6S33_008023 [Morchella sextelata]
MLKRQRETSSEPAVKQRRLEQKLLSLPVHGKRPILKAGLSWTVKGKDEGAQGSFLFDTGCTGAVTGMSSIYGSERKASRYPNTLCTLISTLDHTRGV